MKKSNQNINYLSYLKCEYDRICETPDKTIKEASYRSVCDEMFNSLLNNINSFKLEMLFNTLNAYYKLKIS